MLRKSPEYLVLSHSPDTSQDSSRRLAYAVGQDAGEKSRKVEGRSCWSEDDWNTACEAFNSLVED